MILYYGKEVIHHKNWMIYNYKDNNIYQIKKKRYYLTITEKLKTQNKRRLNMPYMPWRVYWLVPYYILQS